MRTSTVLAAAALVASCNRAASTPPALEPETASAPARAQQPALRGPHVILRPPGHPPVTVRVEVQRTDAQRQRGLMYRQQLDESAGMIFVFRQPDHQVFWMRNTYLPLDMIFITPERRVLGVVQNATPMTDDPREVPGESQYVLEVRAGFAARHHVAAGTPVEFVDIPPAAE